MVDTEGFKAAIAAGKKKPRINIVKLGKTNCRNSLKNTGIYTSLSIKNRPQFFYF
jgi:hypothetical protein